MSIALSKAAALNKSLNELIDEQDKIRSEKNNESVEKLDALNIRFEAALIKEKVHA